MKRGRRIGSEKWSFKFVFVCLRGKKRISKRGRKGERQKEYNAIGRKREKE